MNEEALNVVTIGKTIPLTRSDYKNYRFCVLVEIHGTNNAHNNAKIESFLQKVRGNAYIIDGVMAQNILSHVCLCVYHT